MKWVLQWDKHIIILFCHTYYKEIDNNFEMAIRKVYCISSILKLGTNKQCIVIGQVWPPRESGAVSDRDGVLHGWLPWGPYEIPQVSSRWPIWEGPTRGWSSWYLASFLSFVLLLLSLSLLSFFFSTRLPVGELSWEQIFHAGPLVHIPFCVFLATNE